MNFYYYPYAIFYYNWIKSSFFERNAVSERFWKVLFKKLRFFACASTSVYWPNTVIGNSQILAFIS